MVETFATLGLIACDLLVVQPNDRRLRVAFCPAREINRVSQEDVDIVGL